MLGGVTSAVVFAQIYYGRFSASGERVGRVKAGQRFWVPIRCSINNAGKRSLGLVSEKKENVRIKVEGSTKVGRKLEINCGMVGRAPERILRKRTSSS